MQKQFLGTISALLAILTLAGAQTRGNVVTRGTTLETVGVSRDSGSRINVEITTKDETAPWVETLDHPARIVVDLPNTVLAAGLRPIPIGTNGVKGIRIGTDAENTTRVVVDLARLCGYELVPGSGHRLILKLDPTSPAPPASAAATPGAPARSGYLSPSQSPPAQSAPRNAVTESGTNSEPAAVVAPGTAGVQASTQSAASSAAPTAPAGAPGSNGNTTMVASAQPNMAQPDPPPSTPAVPASAANGASPNAAAGVAGRGTETGAPARGIVVGGHIGAVFPLVTRANGTTTSISDSFSIGMPVGITLHGQGKLAFDMEFVPIVQNSPRQVSLTLHPGVLYGVGHGFTLGMRAAFVSNSSQFGFTPLVNKSWPIEGSFFKAYFVEADLPVRFDRPPGLPATNAVTFAMHLGVGF